MEDINWSDMAMIAGVCIGLFTLFVVVYKAVKGFYPGSRLYEEPLPGPNDLDAQTAKFMMFYTNWCPHCRNAKPHWDSLEKGHKNETITYGGKTVVFEKINCDAATAKCAQYKADSYPTFKLETDSKLYEFVGNPTPALFKTFLNSALGQEKSA